MMLYKNYAKRPISNSLYVGHKYKLYAILRQYPIFFCLTTYVHRSVPGSVWGDLYVKILLSGVSGFICLHSGCMRSLKIYTAKRWKYAKSLNPITESFSCWWIMFYRYFESLYLSRLMFKSVFPAFGLISRTLGSQ